jgi:hypothetical protein
MLATPSVPGPANHGGNAPISVDQEAFARRIQTFLALCQPSRNGIFTTEHGVGRTINLNERLVKAFKDAILNYW